MTYRAVCTAIALMLCLAASFAQAAPRGKPGGGGGEKKPEGGASRSEPGNAAARGSLGGSAPGGSWSQATHQVGRGPGQQNGNAAAGAAFANRNNPQASGAQGAAAGAAAVNRNQPRFTGKEGAAAAAAASNRNSPQYSGAEGAAAGAAAVNRNQPQFSGAEGAAVGTAAVRSSYNNPVLYSQSWYGAHPEVWAAPGATAAAAWAPTTWGAVAGFSGAAATPVVYNYGVNVTSQAGNVMVDGQSVGTEAEFSQQAADLAQAGAAVAPTADDQWLSLGIFAMVRNEQQHPQLIMQLAINKQGLLRGNFTDEVSENTQSIQGAVDSKTQRAAWTVGANKTTVMEAGLSSLATGEAPALIHKNGQTDHWLLIRLDQPGQAANGPTAP